MMSKPKYIDYLLSLKKNSQFEPFEVEWLPLYGVDKVSAWIVDENNSGQEGIHPGENLKDLLIRLVPTIERYPYFWPLEGMSIDKEGYDFSERGNELEIEPVAYKEALRLLRIADVEKDKLTPYSEAERVSAPHVTKFQLTLEKASPLSTLSFQFFSPNPVTLLSLVSERDLNGTGEIENINLEQLSIQQEEDTATILFGRPIFTKRLTFVLGQKNASANTYYVEQKGEDFAYSKKDGDSKLLKGFVSAYHNGQTFLTDDILPDKDLKDWSAERKDAYIKWREAARKRGLYE